jgi:uncharacterized membrane protein YvlD (DUF360 family)
MNYLKSLSLNFFIVFFADYLLPGIEVTHHSRLPSIEGDLIFAACLGFLNSLIYPVLRLLKQEPSLLKLALVALILNFGAYGVIKILPVGITVITIEGYLFAAVVVTVGSFLTNFFEMKKNSHKMDTPQ